MTELIKISESNGKQAVSAKELFLLLGMDRSNYSKWYQKNITTNDFAIEGVDYYLVQSTNTSTSQDFALSIEFAKKLSMLCRTEQGEKARQYFIECEKKIMQPKQLTFLETAKALVASLEKIEEQEKQLALQQPKVEVYDKIIESKDLKTISEVGKIVGLGQKKLFDLLRKQGILMKNNLPYQKYIDNGYFKVKSCYLPEIKSDYSQTFATMKGEVFILSLINKFLKN